MKNSKILATLTAILILFTTFSCKKESPLKDGTYTGSGAGRNGEITVSVTIKNGAVSDAKIISDPESPQIAEPAENLILSEFLQSGSTADIDTVSGATLTSDGLLDALDEALSAARGKAKVQTIYEDTSCDIVIIGAGGAGLVAATQAANKGAKVIVLEKMGIVGGNSNYSTGGINASYTKEQEKLNIKDSPQVFYDDTMKGGHYLNDPELVRTLVNNSASMVEWLQSDLVGADLSDVGIFGGATNRRIHRPQGGKAIGAHLVPLLYKAALAQGAEIRTNNKVIDIIADEKDSNKALGVRVSSKGSEYTILAKAVIIASGGFGANPTMIAKYNPALKDFSTTNHTGATGDIFPMVEKFNAALTQMEQIQTHPTVVAKTGIMITESVRGNGAILVSHEGRRFINEMATRDIVSEAILSGTGKTAYLIFDQGVRNSLKAIESYAQQGLLKEGATVAELAEKLSIPATELEKTITEYNSYVESGSDKKFNRPKASMERTLSTAPFYAVECEPAIHHTMGGLKINTKGQVLDKNGNAITALYAAGEVTGGIHGANRLGGNAVADFCVFGKIVADSALEYIANN